MKHYRIRKLDEGGFFLSRRKTFKTLNEFVAYYSKTSDGLCVVLGKPCPKVRVGVTTALRSACRLTHPVLVSRC